MKIVLTTNSSRRFQFFRPAHAESYGKHGANLCTLLLFIGTALIVGGLCGAHQSWIPHTLNMHFPDKPLLFSVYLSIGLFHYALEGLWVLLALIVALEGLAREKATGAALFLLALPVSRLSLFLIRAAVASAEAIVLGPTSALFISGSLSIRRRSLSLPPGTWIRRVDERWSGSVCLP